MLAAPVDSALSARPVDRSSTHMERPALRIAKLCARIAIAEDGVQQALCCQFCVICPR